MFFKLKVNYLFYDIFQITDSVYINPIDFLAYLYFYVIYIFSYFGPWLPIFLYIVLIYFSKISKYFERSGRSFSFNYQNWLSFNIQFYTAEGIFTINFLAVILAITSWIAFKDLKRDSNHQKLQAQKSKQMQNYEFKI